MGDTRRDGVISTTLGILAILLWGSTIAGIRTVSEQLGALGAGACVHLIAGGIGCLVLGRRDGLRQFLRLPRTYLLGCGLLFVAYAPPLYLAIRGAASREQTVEVAIVNYLWPAMSLALSVPILNKKARLTLLPALLLALAGVYLAMAQGRNVSWSSFRQNLTTNPMPYAMAFTAATLWAFYSNLSRRWADGVQASPVPVFLLATGLVLLAAWWADGIRPPRQAWTPRSVLELVYLSIFPTLLAYVFWDIAMRKGNVVLVNSLSFLIPLISTAVSCVYLRVHAGPGLWIASGLVVAGAIGCRMSITDGRRKVGACGPTCFAKAGPVTDRP